MKEHEFELVTTRGGDNGDTTMYSGERSVKSALVFETVGDLDELNSYLGIIKGKIKLKENVEGLIKTYQLSREINSLQKGIMTIMSLAATNPYSDTYAKLKKIDTSSILKMEKRQIALLKHTKIAEKFIIPGDEGEFSAHIDFARAITRRCERKIVAMIRNEVRTDLIESQQYLNRMSDFLFILARFMEQN